MLRPMAAVARSARVQKTCAGDLRGTGFRNSPYRALGILTVFCENHEEEYE